MLHKETVTSELIDVLQRLTSLPQLSSFRLVGGTAAALQIGHRISVDIDFFSNEKINKRTIVNTLSNAFPGNQLFVGTDSVRGNINGVRVELYDDWQTHFKIDPLLIDGMRIADLNDLAALKLEAITERREKKDYVDLYFMFQTLGQLNVLNDFKKYNPHISDKSILFALGEVNVATENKSVMPEMLLPLNWSDVEKSMLNAARNYLSMHSKVDKPKTN
jgi:hypothetical protein